MTKLRHQLLILFFALFLAFATFFLTGQNFRASFLSSTDDMPQSGFTLVKGADGKILNISGEEFANQDYVIETGDDTETALEFSGDNLVRLDRNTNLRIKTDPVFHISVLQLDQGRIWVNTSYASRDLVFQFREVSILSPSASFAISVTGDSASLVNAKSFLNFRVGKDQERLLFPYQAARISFSDLTPIVAQENVSYSEMKKNPWFAQNFVQDEQFRQRLVQRFTDGLDARGVSMTSVDGAFFDFRRNLHDAGQKFVFDGEKKRQMTREFLLNILDDALYFYRTAAKNEAEKRLSLFLQTVSELNFSAQLLPDIEERFQMLRIFSPQDFTFFSLKKAVRDVLFDYSLGAAGGEKSVFILEKILFTSVSDVLEILFLDSVFSQDLFRQYLLAFQKIPKDSLALQRERDLFSYLLTLSPAFFRDEFFVRQAALNETSQFLVSDSKDAILEGRAAVMRMLRLYFFQELVSLHEARPIAYRLGENFPEHEEFLHFLQSEFPTSPLFGATQKERFSAFQKFEKERQSVNKFQEGFLASPSKDDQKKIEEIIREAQLIFIAAGFRNVVIGSLLQGDQRFVPVEKANVHLSEGDIEFSGIYDRDQGLFSDISLGGEVVYKGGVKLDKIATLLQPKFEESPEIAEENFLKPVETQSEKVARYVLAQNFSQLEFQIFANQISTVNLARKQFNIIGAVLPHGKQNIIVNFTFDMNSRQASRIEIGTLKGPKEISGSIPSDQMALKVRAFYDEHFFEQIEKELGVKKAL